MSTTTPQAEIPTALDSWGRTLEPPDAEEVALLEHVRSLAQPSSLFPGQRVLPLDLADERQRRFFEARFGGGAELGRFFPRKQQVFAATAALHARGGAAIRPEGVHRPHTRDAAHPPLPGWRPGDPAPHPDEAGRAHTWEPALFLSAYGYEGGTGPAMGSAGAAAVLTVPGAAQVQELALELYDRERWLPIAATSSGPSSGSAVSLSAEGVLPVAGAPVAVLATGYYVPQGGRMAIPVLVTADVEPPLSAPAPKQAAAADAAALPETGMRASFGVSGPASFAVVPAGPQLSLTVTDPVNKVTPAGATIRVAINRTNVLNDCDYYYIEPTVGSAPAEIDLAIGGRAEAAPGNRFDAVTASNLNGSLVLVCRSGASAGGAMVFPSSEIPPAVVASGAELAWRINPAQSTQVPFWQSGDVLDLYFTLNFAMNGSPTGRPNVSLTVTSDTSVQASLPNVAITPPLQFLWGCVAADEAVRMADGSLRAIRDVAIDDRVRADAGGRALRVADVTRGHEPGPMVELLTVDGRCLRMTGAHPVMVPGGWALARDLARGDVVETEDGPRALASVEPAAPGAVRNLVLAPDEEGAAPPQPGEAAFFAAGIRVGDHALQGLALRDVVASAAGAAARRGFAADPAWSHDAENFRRRAAGLPLVPAG